MEPVLNKYNKIQYIINNIDNLELLERKEVAQIIWDNNIETRKYIEEKSDGLLIKTKIFNDKLSNKLYNYIKSIL